MQAVSCMLTSSLLLCRPEPNRFHHVMCSCKHCMRKVILHVLLKAGNSEAAANLQCDAARAKRMRMPGSLHTAVLMLCLQQAVHNRHI